MVVTILNFIVFLISSLIDLREESKRPRILKMHSDEEEDEALVT